MLVVKGVVVVQESLVEGDEDCVPDTFEYILRCSANSYRCYRGTMFDRPQISALQKLQKYADR